MNKLEELVENFELLGDWEERYRYIIDIGRKLPPYPEEARDEAHKIKGCISQVWMTYRVSDGSPPLLEFLADSDAHIVKGLIGIALYIYSNRTAQKILDVEISDVFDKLGLNEHLSPNRRSGFQALLAQIKSIAQQHLSQKVPQ
jgi:cysteine desulfuration protein SufE